MQETLKIDGATAKALYPSATGEFKKSLESHFGLEYFITPKITDLVRSFEDACKIVGVRPDDVVLPSDNPDEAAYKKIKVIAMALNERWKPDWTNEDEYKYYPWFDLSSGSGLRYFVCVNLRSSSDVGSRLCFKSSELAEYAGRTFIDIYTDFFIIK